MAVRVEGIRDQDGYRSREVEAQEAASLVEKSWGLLSGADTSVKSIESNRLPQEIFGVTSSDSAAFVENTCECGKCECEHCQLGTKSIIPENATMLLSKEL